MKKISILILCAVLPALYASAQVRVVKSSDRKITIDLSGLRGSGDVSSQTFLQTLEKDLRLSGWLDPVRAGGEVRVNGAVSPSGSELKAGCQVVRLNDQSMLLSKNYNGQPREQAHRMADDIIEAVTGHKGFASMRIVLVGNRTGKKELYLCDSDGGNVRPLTGEGRIAIGPNWGPDGRSIVYTSYMRDFPDICRIDLERNRRETLANYGGLNTGAAISPDGKELALILSKDGNPELYIKNIRSGKLTRLTNSPRAAEASPDWSPDGSQLVYASDQGGTGRPQLYIISRDGGTPRRISSRGSENVAPDWGPNGLIVCSSRMGGQYVIAVIQPSNGQTFYLPLDGADYEDPSWAPDGRHIVAARTFQYQSSLYLLDTVSDRPVALLQGGGSWYSPACSP
ncbi:MAG: PD40 domain-containing protein [Verrucomicrobia bacterium]|nr:PD40 domain-containing protein [Verrucomicrobiota bacterium]